MCWLHQEAVYPHLKSNFYIIYQIIFFNSAEQIRNPLSSFVPWSEYITNKMK